MRGVCGRNVRLATLVSGFHLEMNEMEIREVRSEDESAELDVLLWEVLWQPLNLPCSTREAFSIEGELLELVAMADSQMLGGLVANWVSPIEVELRHLAVRPEAKGKDIGRKLVGKLISIASKRKCSTVSTIARSTSAGFFKELGFIHQPGKAPEHPVFKKHGITFESFRYQRIDVEPNAPVYE